VLPPYYGYVKELLTDPGQVLTKASNVNARLRQHYANVTVILNQYKEAALLKDGTIIIAQIVN